MAGSAGSAAEEGHGGVVAGDAADAAAAPGAGAAEQDALVRCLYAPHACLARVVGERPGKVPVKYVAARQTCLRLQIDGRLHLDARSAVGVAQQALLDRLA